MTEVTAILVTVQGEVSVIDLAEKTSVLDGMREAIDCRWVDRVALAFNTDMWLDDEGMLKAQGIKSYEETVNPYAQAIVAKYMGYEPNEIQPFFGSILVTGQKNGDTTSVTPEDIDLVTKVVNRMK